MAKKVKALQRTARASRGDPDDADLHRLIRAMLAHITKLEEERDIYKKVVEELNRRRTR